MVMATATPTDEGCVAKTPPGLIHRVVPKDDVGVEVRVADRCWPVSSNMMMPEKNATHTWRV